jgi:hypothetical protein
MEIDQGMVNITEAVNAKNGDAIPVYLPNVPCKEAA